MVEIGPGRIVVLLAVSKMHQCFMGLLMGTLFSWRAPSAHPSSIFELTAMSLASVGSSSGPIFELMMRSQGGCKTWHVIEPAWPR